ncbi:MAG TPA: hypothetical protein VG411_08975, partial [Actinomycetota bacterium]|nr:hypothetical protein [Actinomycetota bacterium]
MSTAGTAIRGARREMRPPRRVVLLSESMGLAALLKYLLGASGTVTRFTGVREAADHDGLLDADTVVLDLPRDGADTTLAQVRHRYRGELIVLADRGRGRSHAAPDPAWTLLERPFSAVDLGTALGLPGLDAATAPGPKADRHPPVELRTPRPLPTALAGPDAGAAAPADVKVAARRSPTWAPFAAAAGTAHAGLVDRATRLLAALTEGWQAKRRVRVAGFSAFALVAFTVAFVLAAQGGRCGPGCDAIGTVFSPDPTVAPAESSAPSTTGPKRSTTTTAALGGSPGTGAFRGVSGGRLATTTTGQRATTTTRKPSPGGSPSTRPPTTRPPTTTPTTSPTTTPTTSPTTTPTTEP